MSTLSIYIMLILYSLANASPSYLHLETWQCSAQPISNDSSQMTRIGSPARLNHYHNQKFFHLDMLPMDTVMDPHKAQQPLTIGVRPGETI